LTDCKEIARRITELRRKGQVSEALKLGYESLKDCGSSWAVRGALAWSVRDAKIKTFKSDQAAHWGGYDIRLRKFPHFELDLVIFRIVRFALFDLGKLSSESGIAFSQFSNGETLCFVI